ncbi:hypothetical protein RCCGE510_05492 [Rhizobium sp. CCGE 510]|nr:hypothetical protein RCCGE510_05492 [Rhizobium sp. CCGE 510]
MVDSPHSVSDGGEATDPGSNDRRRSNAVLLRNGLPTRLRKCFVSRCEREKNKAIDLSLIFQRQHKIRIEPCFCVLGDGWDHATDLGGEITDNLVR